MSAEPREHEELYAAVVARPDDDEPRLAFAAQLEREGDQARADFIRLQCAYAKLPDGVDRAAEWAPIAALLKEHGEEWLGGLSKVATVRNYWRGFLGSVDGSSEQIVACSEELERTAPVSHLTVQTGESEEGEQLAPGFVELALLERVQGLHLAEGMSAAALAKVLASPRLGKLRSISLFDGEGFPQVIEEVARAIPPGLRMLSLIGFIGTDFNDRCAEVLAGAPSVAELEHLRLWNCNLKSEGAVALARSPYLKKLRALDLGLGQYTLNKIRGEGCKALAAEGALPSLSSLDLDFNDVGDEGWLAMVQSGKLERFTLLRLQKCQLSDASLVPMFEAGRMDALVTLDLSHNLMGPAGAKALAAMAPRQLRNLWLYGDPIGDEGVAAVVQAPWLGQLKELNLDLVGMTERGVELLVASPQLDSIPRVICELQKPQLSAAAKEQLKRKLGARLVRAPIGDLRAAGS